MPELPSGIVAFLFADLESAASGWETNYPATATRVDHMVETLRAAAASQEGAVFKVIGESAQAAFPDVPGAVAAALVAQRTLSALWPADQLPRLAIHTGEATPRRGDYLAPALNRLARLTAASHAGQILLTEAARASVGDLRPDVQVVDLGRHRLRDLLEAEAVYQVQTSDLPAAFPPLRSLSGSPHNLPVQATRLIGREADLGHIHEAIQAGERLVTLLGPGGVGKTRLALQAGADELDGFPDGVWWVPLAAVADPSLVLEAIAAAMPHRLPPDVSLVEALPALLRSRRDLLILDNLEQIPAAAPVIGRLLANAPQTVVLATSRMPLGLPEETEILIDPLPTPDEGPADALASAVGSPAVELFVERARAVRPAFDLTADNAGDVIDICRRLDGLPLAIELAAARIRVLAPAALKERLGHSLSLLTGGARDLPTRQQTLRAAIRWSFDLLSPAERSTFARLAVMAPGFTGEAVVRVLGGDVSGPEITSLLEGLEDQSLLRSIPSPDGRRWSMLTTIHDFAAELLEARPETAALRLTHAHAYLAVAEESEWFDVMNQPNVAESFELDHDNYRVALSTLQQAGPAEANSLLRLSTLLANFWWIRGHATEGRAWLQQAIAAAPDDRSLDMGRALGSAGLLAEAQSDLTAARESQERALVIFRENGFASGIADALTGLAVIARSEGDLNRARVLHQEAHDVWAALGDVQGTAGALLDMGVISYLRGDYDNARQTLGEALTRFNATSDPGGEAYAQQLLSAVAVMEARYADAIAGFQRCIDMWQELGNEPSLAIDRMNLAEVLLLDGNPDAAEALLVQAVVDFEDLADSARRGTALGLLARVLLTRGDIAAADAMLLDALRLTWEHRDLPGTASVLDAMAEVAAAQHDLTRARLLVAASDHLRASTGVRRLPAITARLTSAVPWSTTTVSRESDSPED
ncbi:MAG: tetratricopeptide repeat protein, partial [Thermomicrobiales bacterium]|nr:tetratricopeptide repeat protein [Thermomicrobiales bacterium]